MLLRAVPVLLFVSSFVAAQAATSDQAPPLTDRMADAIAKEGTEHSQVMRLLRDLTGIVGHRLTGSDNFTKGCEWAKGEFEKMGLSVELEKWAEWKLVWNRGVWVGRITQPIALDMYVATQAWTAGTAGRRKAPIVLEPDWDAEGAAAAVEGKWVLTKKKFRLQDPRIPALAAKVGAAKALALVYRAGDPDNAFPTRVRVFGNHQTAMKTLADVPTTPEIAVQADHFDQLAALLDEGKAAECEFEIGNAFREGPIALHNVIATLPGSDRADECVVVSSHLDSWHQVQGTTDNGTGSTTTLESARILTAVKAKPRRTIKFCLWGGEEQGLLGSAAHVRRHRTAMPKVSAAFNHDTGTNWAQALGVTAAMAEQLAPIAAQVNRVLKAPDADWKGEVFKLNPVARMGGGGGGSDNASFLAAGVPGLNWNLKGRSNYFAHTWHTQWDTIDVAIEEYQRHTATVIALMVLGTANLPALLDRTNVGGVAGGPSQSQQIAEAYFGAELDEFTFKSVKADGRAAKMGVQKGDVLKKVAGQELERQRQIFQFARDAEGDSVTFTFQRGATTFEAKAAKDELPALPA
ncbi:MAG: M28 family peptidase, partial [Planctomycetota bacterium]